MILKFRDAHIAKLEKSQKTNEYLNTSDERDKEIVRFMRVGVHNYVGRLCMSFEK